MKNSCSIVKRLEGIEWSRFGAALVIIFGSVVKCSSSPRDVDILVIPWTRLDIDAEAKLMEALEKSVNLPVDLAVLDPDDPDCNLLQIVLSEGRIVYVDDGRAAALLSKLIMMCYDFALSKRKIRFLETMIEKVKV